MTGTTGKRSIFTWLARLAILHAPPAHVECNKKKKKKKKKKKRRKKTNERNRRKFNSLQLHFLSKRSFSSRIVANISHHFSFLFPFFFFFFLLFSYIRNEIYRTPGKIHIWHWIPVDGAPQARIAIHLASINYDRVDLGLATPISSSRSIFVFR